MRAMRLLAVVVGFCVWACSNSDKHAGLDGGRAGTGSMNASGSGGAAAPTNTGVGTGGRAVLDAGSAGQRSASGGQTASSGGRAASGGRSGGRNMRDASVMTGSSGVSGSAGMTGGAGRQRDAGATTGGAGASTAGTGAAGANNDLCQVYCECMADVCKDKVFPQGCMTECLGQTNWDLQCRKDMCWLVGAQPNNGHCDHAFGEYQCLDK